jgi:hypothetical protein
MLEEIKKEIPEAVMVKDNFGGDYYYIPSNILSKRKAWNVLLKRGFLQQPNKQYLKKGNIYIYNNYLKNYLIIQVGN